MPKKEKLRDGEEEERREEGGKMIVGREKKWDWSENNLRIWVF